MIDLETLGLTPDGVIVSIGAVQFDLVTGKIGDTFYINVSAESCQQYGLKINASTVEWWLSQDQAAVNAWLQGTSESLPEALKLFNQWVSGVFSPKKPTVWSNGATFDIVLMRNAYTVTGLKCPWHFRNERDVRTLVGLAKLGRAKPPTSGRTGTHHNALDDAQYQAAYCHEAYKFITKWST
jgi:exodeoxyribonuclease VIII